MPNSRLYHGVMCQMTAVEILDNNESSFERNQMRMLTVFNFQIFPYSIYECGL